MIPIDSADLANVLIAATSTALSPSGDTALEAALVRSWGVLRYADVTVANEALNLVADRCGRHVAEALLHAVEDERLHEAALHEAAGMHPEARPDGHNGVEYPT